jgi:hypothetical protein
MKEQYSSKNVAFSETTGINKNQLEELHLMDWLEKENMQLTKK